MNSSSFFFINKCSFTPNFRILKVLLEDKILKLKLEMDSVENEVPDIEKVNGINGYKIFISKHQNQLESSGVPNHLWQTLYKKLVNMVS